MAVDDRVFGQWEREIKTLQANAGRIVKAAAFSVLQDQIDRIHSRGLNSSNSQIGEYTSKAYINFRKRKGLRTDKVNLELTSRMRQDYSIVKATKKQVILGFKSPRNADKADWMEDRYGDIYKPTAEEDLTFQRVVEFELNRILSGSN